MHKLVYLLAQKAEKVFQGRLLPQVIDQNWDMKAFKAVLCRMLEVMHLMESAPAQRLVKQIESTITEQNERSEECLATLRDMMAPVD